MKILRYAAFSSDPKGGNPAGVVLDATGATPVDMQRVAAEVGYSETAFLVPVSDRVFDVRYFSPLAEVPFCGHATIASGVASAEAGSPGLLEFRTRAGLVRVEVKRVGGSWEATLVSVSPRVTALSEEDQRELLAALDWSEEDLDPELPTRGAFAGAWHPVIAARSRERLGDLHYDYPRLAALMAARDWTTVQLVWAETPTRFHARNPFPPGGVIEDPATGAAAAAFGGYLRALGLVGTPAEVLIVQGEDLGRPGTLKVSVPVDADSGIAVTGAAVRLPDPTQVTP